jgi:hypothetical protein
MLSVMRKLPPRHRTIFIVDIVTTRVDDIASLASPADALAHIADDCRRRLLGVLPWNQARRQAVAEAT